MLEVLIEDLNPVSGAQSDMRSEHPDPRSLAHRTVSPACGGWGTFVSRFGAVDGFTPPATPYGAHLEGRQADAPRPPNREDWSPACQDERQSSTYPTSSRESTVLKAPCDTSDTGRVRGGGERVGCKR